MTEKERAVALLIRDLLEKQKGIYVFLAIELDRVKSLLERGNSEYAVSIINHIISDLNIGIGGEKK